eukprot:SAG31_NODE_16503_length_706_cov_2.451400_1_plen_47_part_10
MLRVFCIIVHTAQLPSALAPPSLVTGAAHVGLLRLRLTTIAAVAIVA